ncbi:hypothetical protein OQE61_00500 [Cetobacterium somerae]|uniref:hypothetical protein n=1 Tax=Cetobacterium somerae TaxID=188913 RepID=UPI0022501044|nr:hypothetical protein [Cetobacterium somerae]MCX3065972.1 hypothetical protein [Cetobacterium somerae]
MKINTNKSKIISEFILSFLLPLLTFGIGYKQYKISEFQAEISKIQIKLAQMESQPFFEITEHIENNNRHIYIFNSGKECYINHVSAISFLDITYSEGNLYEILTIPINIFSSKQKYRTSEKLIYKIGGYQNANFIPLFYSTHQDKVNYLNRRTYLSITYTDRLKKQHKYYFTSKGEILDDKIGESYFHFHKLLEKQFQNLHTSPPSFEDINNEYLNNIINNVSLKTKVSILKDYYNFQ